MDISFTLDQKKLLRVPLYISGIAIHGGSHGITRTVLLIHSVFRKKKTCKVFMWDILFIYSNVYLDIQKLIAKIDSRNIWLRQKYLTQLKLVSKQIFEICRDYQSSRQDQEWFTSQLLRKIYYTTHEIAFFNTQSTFQPRGIIS